MGVRGWVMRAYWEDRGSELVADAAIDDTVLAVEHVGEFDDDPDDMPTGMWLELNGVQLPYVAVDEDADTITLANPLPFAASVDDKVSVVSGGQIMRDYMVDVDLGSGDPAEVVIPFGDRDLWPEGDYASPVQVLLSNDLERIEEVPGRTPERDPAFTSGGLFPVSLPSDISFPPGSEAVINQWVTGGAWDFKTYSYYSELGESQVRETGAYLVTGAVRWAANSSGRRVLKMTSSWAGVETEEVVLSADAPDSGPVSLTFAIPLTAFDLTTFRLAVWQNSGASLDVLKVGTYMRIVRLR